MSHPLGKVHIVGIAGAGMSAYARLLLSQGARVSGSDAKESKRLVALAAEGATTFVGHSATHVVNESGEAIVDTVCASTAVPAHNVELAAAREAGIRVLNRSELLCAITAPYRVVSVAGTHGKTTTTSMATLVLQEAGLDPSFAIGSELNETGSNAHLGTSDFFVVEADESDGTFLNINTEIGIITNVEPDHLNYWQSFDRIHEAFVEFCVKATVARSGVTVVCMDDSGAAAVAADAQLRGAKIATYGQSESADFQIRNVSVDGIRFSADVYFEGQVWLSMSLQVPGIHNVLNATAAAVAAHFAGASTSDIEQGLRRFSGTRRRFDFKGEVAGVRVFDDYAHHPTEIAATLEAARQVAGSARVVVAFQAHHYYRTALFSREFGEALGKADFVVVLEVFAPGEEFIDGADGQTLANNVPLPTESVVFEPSWSAVTPHLVNAAQPGDIIMTLGAGEIGMLCPDIIAGLQERFIQNG